MNPAWKAVLAPISAGLFLAAFLRPIASLAEGTPEAQPSKPPAHWAFQPIPKAGRSPAPTPGGRLSFIDAHLNNRLAEAGLAYSPPADKRTLIRRANFDLIGLPPAPEEVDAFLNDSNPRAFEAVVDRLLASPRYGERWGRHWMDVVRYADTAGDNADFPVPELHRYRDYIIDAFNADMPFDRFVVEQLAGDILARQAPSADAESMTIATGFLALSRRYGTGPYELWHLTLENTLETVGQAFMGLNLKCARCHDHKFDPLTMKDYYGLYGIFASTEFPWAGSEEIQTKQFNRQKFVPLEDAASIEAKTLRWRDRIASLKDNIRVLEQTNAVPQPTSEDRKKKLAALKADLRALEKPGLPPDLKTAYAVTEGTPADVPLQKRGEPSNPGTAAARCVPEALAGAAPFNIAPGSSGRLEFARWLASTNHPLTARVMVNRIWHHHFGRGLVATPNNFGSNGEGPSHPELLDQLALRFMENNWSVKSMHRLIMNSAAYQRSSAPASASIALDPANRLLSRFNRKRLEAEAIRDATLWVSGSLDLGIPGAHPFPPPAKWSWTQHQPFKERYESNHRGVYLMTQRFQKHPFLALFDGPDTNASTESRRASTVPQQALFALNNAFMETQSRALARRILRESAEEPQRLQLLHRLAWSRPASRDETARCLEWLRALKLASQRAQPEATEPILAEQAWTSLAKAVLNSNEFLYVD